MFFLLFISSKSVLDFMFSGLENSLSYFLIALFFFIVYCDCATINNFTLLLALY